MKLENKVVIVTGGASGLGLASTQALLEASAQVAIIDIHPDAQANLDSLGLKGYRLYQADVTNDEACNDTINQITHDFGQVNVLLNCAGIAPAKKVLNRENQAMALTDFSKVIQINLIGSFNMIRLAAQAMANNTPEGSEGERGVIINTASVAAYEGQIGQAAYAASKAGIIGMTLPLARDLAPLGIRVNSIAPGIMGTPMLLAMPENVQQGLVSNIQFPKRMGLPSEFASLVQHIISNSYINGETIRLDGAIRMTAR